MTRNSFILYFHCRKSSTVTMKDSLTPPLPHSSYYLLCIMQNRSIPRKLHNLYRMSTTSSQKEQNFIANSTRRKILRKYRDQMIVHIVVYIMLLSISNCCAAINIHLFIYLFLLLLTFDPQCNNARPDPNMHVAHFCKVTCLAYFLTPKNQKPC